MVKFKIYNHPLYDTLRYIARVALTKSNSNKSKANKSEVTDELIESLVAEYTSQFNIQTMWVGEMRGRTLSNAYVIVDEYQNCSSSTGQLILSRLDKDCKVVCIGSNRQIDNIYTNKYINALSGLLKAAQDSDHSINLFACELTKVLRGPLVEFAEKIYSK
jgi:PhoH-like ATPase